MTAVLELREVVGGYGPVTVLNGLNLSVKSGERLAILGRNGVGKTTAMKAVMGLATLRSGHIFFEGEDITGLSPVARAMRGIGYVPQTRDIFKSLSVEENLVAGLKRGPRSGLELAYSLFPRLKERRLNGGGQLSGGEQQMLSVARALLGRPRLMLLDEPLEGLAPIIRSELLAAFGRMVEETGMAVVVVEQQVFEALSFAGEAVIMERGAAQVCGRAGDLLRDPRLLERHLAVRVH